MTPRPLRARVSRRRNPITRKVRWWVTFLDPNGEPLAHSEMLTSEANAAKNAAAMHVAFDDIEWSTS